MESLAFTLLSDSLVPNVPGLTDAQFKGRNKDNVARKAFIYICKRHGENRNPTACTYRFSIRDDETGTIYHYVMERAPLS